MEEAAAAWQNNNEEPELDEATASQQEVGNLEVEAVNEEVATFRSEEEVRQNHLEQLKNDIPLEYGGDGYI